MLAFPCPACEYRLLAHPGKAGKTLACPRCKTNVTVPATETGSSVFESESQRIQDSSSVLAGLEAASGGSATAAPTRRTARFAAPPPPRPHGKVKDAVVFDTPTPPKYSEDLFVQLTTALTLRMNPPPDPPADLRLSTGVWMLATALGIGLWVFAVLYDTDWLKYVWAIGGLEFAIGIVWVVHRAGSRNVSKGLLALLPPITAYRLICRGGQDGYRPLRFALSGLLLTALPFIALPARAVVRNAMGWTNPTVATDRPADSPAGKLRQITERSVTAELIQKELQRLAAEGGEPMSANEKAELVAAFRKLLKHDNADVRAEALRTLYVWEKDAARSDVMDLLGSEYRDDRAAALSLLKKWPDEAAVKAAIGRLTSEEDRFHAKDTLVEIGKSAPKVVEKVLLETLLPSAKPDPVPAKPLLELIEVVGNGKGAVDGLDAYIAATTDPFLKDLAQQKKKAIENRIKPKPSKQ